MIGSESVILSSKFVTFVIAAATASVIIAAVAKQLGAWLGWFGDAERLAIVGGLSVTNLLLVSCLSLAAAIRLRHSDQHGTRDWLFWLLIGGGFLFLFADSTLNVNEWLETRFEQLVGLSPTDWTHHIDDVLVAIAGMLGIGAIVYWRDVLIRSPESARLYCAATVLLCVMMLLDLCTDSFETTTPEFGSLGSTELTRGAIELVEDTLMLIGEALLVIGTFIAFQAAGRRPQV